MVALCNWSTALFTYMYIHPLWILAPTVDATTCADDATACDANGNGATACFNGVCVGK